MNVIVTGASGMLGKDICRVLELDNHNVFGVSFDMNPHMRSDRQFQGNLADKIFVDKVLQESKADVIIHCAAIVNVDQCEKDKELADSVHIKATAMLASYNPGKARIIYISTDSVFDGKVGNYTEEDATHPLNYYAFSKLQGEVAALGNNPNSLIIRTNIYGFHTPLGKSLAEWAIDNMSVNKTISGFNDTFFNPVYTGQLAAIIGKYFINGSNRGIWNVVSEGYVSKYEFLIRLARVFNFPESLVLQNSMDSVNFIAPRPKITYLNTHKLNSKLGVKLNLQSGIEDFKIDYLRFVKSKV
jgi:dTDP-4-dehydrorhamnose reductase